jgi:hypothetical protein
MYNVKLLRYLRGQPRYDTWENIRVASRSHFINLELFELVNSRIGRLETAILEALLVITESKKMEMKNGVLRTAVELKIIF